MVRYLLFLLASLISNSVFAYAIAGNESAIWISPRNAIAGGNSYQQGELAFEGTLAFSIDDVAVNQSSTNSGDGHATTSLSHSDFDSPFFSMILSADANADHYGSANASIDTSFTYTVKNLGGTTFDSLQYWVDYTAYFPTNFPYGAVTDNPSYSLASYTGLNEFTNAAPGFTQAGCDTTDPVAAPGTLGKSVLPDGSAACQSVGAAIAGTFINITDFAPGDVFSFQVKQSVHAYAVAVPEPPAMTLLLVGTGIMIGNQLRIKGRRG